MKYYLLLILSVLKLTCLYAANDSVLFSKNGDYVLERNSNYDFLNGCHCNYWKLYEINKNESTYTVVFENDSVYFLQYEEPGQKTGNFFKTKNAKDETCTTLASVFKVLPIAQYNSEYQFSLPAILSSDTVVFTNKTINTHSESLLTDIDSLDTDSLEIYDEDSTLYFDINVRLMFNEEKLVDDTISTNIPEIEHHYKVYYSSDNNFYFVRGWYGFSERASKLKNNPGIATYPSSVVLNKIGRRKKPG